MGDVIYGWPLIFHFLSRSNSTVGIMAHYPVGMIFFGSLKTNGSLDLKLFESIHFLLLTSNG